MIRFVKKVFSVEKYFSSDSEQFFQSVLSSTCFSLWAYNATSHACMHIFNKHFCWSTELAGWNTLNCSSLLLFFLQAINCLHKIHSRFSKTLLVPWNTKIDSQEVSQKRRLMLTRAVSLVCISYVLTHWSFAFTNIIFRKQTLVAWDSKSQDMKQFHCVK